MLSQFFEVEMEEGQLDRYLALAASLKPALSAMGGCIFLDRFKSLTRQNLLLSYQVWKDEGSMTAWRVDEKHHAVQVMGRETIFSDYRIRIAQVLHEARPASDVWRPDRRSLYNDPGRRPPTYVVASESARAGLPIKMQWRHDTFESVSRHGHFAHLIDVPDYRSGLELGGELLSDPTTEYFRVFEVMRDYGMYDRREAPQYYPPVR